MHEEILKRLAEKRDALIADRDAKVEARKEITDAIKAEARSESTAEEAEKFRALTAEIKDLDAKIAANDEERSDLQAEEVRSKEIAAKTAELRKAAPKLESVKEARTYEKGNGNSYIQDFMKVALRRGDEAASQERLNRHAAEVRSDKEFRDLNRTDGNGGYATPPLWVTSQFIELARAGRAYANLVPSAPLPGGTDSINIPKIATGTSTAIQTADNAAISETDLTDTFVNAPVKTIAGMQDIALQLLDQSPIAFDELVFRDLIADHATKVDLQVISGSGSSGQVTGIRNTSSIETIAFAGSGVPALYSKIADAVQRVHTLRFLPPEVIVMHPRRWAWFLAAADTAGRPLVTPVAPTNGIGALGAVASQQVVGQLHGLPVVTDPNIPTNLGGGTNEDVIHVLRASDLQLFEGPVRMAVDPFTGSGTLTTRLRVHSYLAFTAARFPKSIVEIGGLTAPTF